LRQTCSPLPDLYGPGDLQAPYQRRPGLEPVWGAHYESSRTRRLISAHMIASRNAMMTTGFETSLAIANSTYREHRRGVSLIPGADTPDVGRLYRQCCHQHRAPGSLRCPYPFRAQNQRQ
jgi:hypothetical protein